MSKIFVFGTARGDVKGKDDERGTVAVKTATLPEAQAVFVKAKGKKDPRVAVVRLPRSNEHVDEVIHSPDVATHATGKPNETRIEVGDVTVHALPEPKPDTAGDIASVFEALDAGGKVPGAKAARSRSSAPKKAKAKKARTKKGAAADAVT
jgi:hypothetical protein